jgi:hypothetical protein
MLTAEFDLNIAERVWQEIGEERKQREILALIDTVGSLEQLKEQLTAKAGLHRITDKRNPHNRN